MLIRRYAEAVQRIPLKVNYLIAPDILIRTSGEHRLSNFLLWEVRRSRSILTLIRGHNELVFIICSWLIRRYFS